MRKVLDGRNTFGLDLQELIVTLSLLRKSKHENAFLKEKDYGNDTFNNAGAGDGGERF
jgi:hypothetical protein